MENPRPAVLLLFDVDGTLIGGSRAGQVAYAEAIRHCFGVEVDPDERFTAGRTDLSIMQELLARKGVSTNRMALDRLAWAYMASLEQTVLRDPGAVLPGVRTLLDGLSRRGEIFLGLGTGNLEGAARIKLRFHGLESYFSTGGFGSDSVERSDLIAAGIRKAEERHGAVFDRIAVIGDTPFDVEAARANGALSIAVATGLYSQAALQKTGATAVLSDLRDGDLFLKALKG